MRPIRAPGQIPQTPPLLSNKTPKRQMTSVGGRFFFFLGIFFCDCVFTVHAVLWLNEAWTHYTTFKSSCAPLSSSVVKDFSLSVEINFSFFFFCLKILCLNLNSALKNPFCTNEAKALSDWYKCKKSLFYFMFPMEVMFQTKVTCVEYI